MLDTTNLMKWLERELTPLSCLLQGEVGRLDDAGVTGPFGGATGSPHFPGAGEPGTGHWKATERRRGPRNTERDTNTDNDGTSKWCDGNKCRGRGLGPRRGC